MSKIKCGIIGASGYAGSELVRLLCAHPNVEIASINARSHIGKSIHELYPGFNECLDMVFEKEEDTIEKSDCIFLSLPHGFSEPIVAKCIEKGKKVIDLGADFRLNDPYDYEQWYGLTYQDVSLHQQSVYGLSEIHRSFIKDANIIGNPGCYPTSIALGLYPLLKENLADVSHIIIDAKSGTTGGGKEANENFHYPRRNEAFAPYKVAQHRHTPEIEQMLSEIAKQPCKITFVPHLLPINRGIISTIYIPLNKEIKEQDLYNIYNQYYCDEKFVRVLPLGKIADLKFVKYSNYCDISLHLDVRNNTLILVSAIDNMIKGAAGQAIQNMNIMYGFNEDSALTMIAPSF